MSSKNIFGLVLAFLVLMQAVFAYANPATVPLGTSANYVVLAESGITTTGVTAIIGDLGIYPNGDTSMAGFGQIMDGSGTFSISSLVDGKIYANFYTAPTPGILNTAINDKGTAYVNAAGRTPDEVNLIAHGPATGNLGGQTLVRGVYGFDQNVHITGGDLTLFGGPDDVFIFKTSGTLDCSTDVPNRAVILTGGAQAQNVFWAVAGQTTLHPNCAFQGIIIDATGIALQDGASLNGRALAHTAVTLIGNDIAILPPVPVPVSNDSLNVSGCMEINGPGAYRMNKSLVGANISTTPADLACIYITSSDVALDCNGFRITNNGTSGTTYGILVSGTSSNVTVTNCAGISQYTYGVEIYDSTDTEFINLVTFDNENDGFFVDESADTSVSNSMAYENGAAFTFTDTSGTNTLANVTAHDNDGAVFYFDTTGDNTVTNGLAADNAGSAFYFSSTGINTLTGNIAHDNDDAFTISSGLDSVLTGNTAFDNNGLGTYILNSDGTTVTNHHLYNNVLDMQLEGSGMWVGLYGVIFDSPAGGFTSYTNLSLEDNVNPGYTINWAAQPAALPAGTTSFRSKFVDIAQISGAETIDSAVWGWRNSEKGGFSVMDLGIWEYDGTWTYLGGTLDILANTLSLSNINADASTFAILANRTTSTGGDDGGGNPLSPLSIGFSAGCDGNVVTVTSSGDPVRGATVVVDGTIIGETDSSGKITFDECGDSAVILARADGYTNTQNERYDLISCEECQPGGCSSNNDCPSTKECSGGECVAVSCPDGQVVNHQCVPDEEPTEPGCTAPNCCTADSQCSGSQECVIASGSTRGSCQQVTGQCGYASNHAWIAYQCGSEASCPQCSSWQSCLNNQCVQIGVTCNQSSATVGATVTCHLTQDNEACTTCNVTITAPDGSRTTVFADANGDVELHLSTIGSYNVANGPSTVQVVSSKAATTPAAPATTPATTPAKGPDYPCLIALLIVVLLIIAGAVYYWQGMKKK